MSITGIHPRTGATPAQAAAAIDDALVPFPINNLPAWETGRYYDISASGLATASAALSLVPNIIAYAPLWVPYDVSIDRFAIYVSTQSGTGGATARLALYAKHATLWKPGALIHEAASTVAIDSTGLKTATVDLDLDGGTWYWTAVNASASGASINGITVGPAHRGRSDLSVGPESGTQESLAYGAMPANATPLAGGTSLRIVSVRAV